MHIISTDEKQVFAAVQEWNQNNTYSLYISDSPGVYFTLSLENLRTSRGPAGNLLVDFYKVCSRCPSRAAAVPFQSNGQHTHPPHPQSRNTRRLCRRKTCFFPPPQLFTVSLYQKEEMVLSPLIKDGAFISQHISLLPLNLLDCGLVFFLFVFKAPLILPSFYLDCASVYKAPQVHIKSICLRFFPQKVRQHKQMIPLCCVLFSYVRHCGRYNSLCVAPVFYFLSKKIFKVLMLSD